MVWKPMTGYYVYIMVEPGEEKGVFHLLVHVTNVKMGDPFIKVRDDGKSWWRFTPTLCQWCIKLNASVWFD